MPDIIRLLPDNVANQIAAGEVIQRPASAVKELLENAIDAKATQIKLYLKDAGRTLVQVVDNGIGMSPTDARLAFERHATSKIRSADDLFTLHTKGFRGEALASIASIAQVELITCQEGQEVGTSLRIEGNKIIEQVPMVASRGTSIAMKHLFFNVPARRNFLKSDAVEMRHILDEFHRVVLAHPDLQFSLFHNDVEQFALPATTLSYEGKTAQVNLPIHFQWKGGTEYTNVTKRMQITLPKTLVAAYNVQISFDATARFAYPTTKTEQELYQKAGIEGETFSHYVFTKFKAVNVATTIWNAEGTQQLKTSNKGEVRIITRLKKDGASIRLAYINKELGLYITSPITPLQGGYDSFW